MTGDQIYVFLVCVLSGIVGGVLYDVLYLVRYPFRSRAVCIVTDVFFGLLFAGLFLFVSVTFYLPGLRFYMLIGCGVGLLLYLKSFHEIVAFFAQKVYNHCEKKKCVKRSEKKPWKNRKKKSRESQ